MRAVNWLPLRCVRRCWHARQSLSRDALRVTAALLYLSLRCFSLRSRVACHRLHRCRVGHPAVLLQVTSPLSPLPCEGHLGSLWCVTSPHCCHRGRRLSIPLRVTSPRAGVCRQCANRELPSAYLQLQCVDRRSLPPFFATLPSAAVASLLLWLVLATGQQLA